MKKIILLIGILMIVSNVNARGGGVACPYVDERLMLYSNHVIYSNYTDIVIFRVPECYGNFGCYGIIQNYKILNQIIDINFKFVNFTNQEKMNAIYLKNFHQSCYDRRYNFGKVTYHEKAIAGTHWY